MHKALAYTGLDKHGFQKGQTLTRREGIPREPVAGGGAIARQSYDDSRLWNCW